MSGRRLLISIVGSILFLGSALLLLWSAVSTSTARLSASTSGSGSFVAGTVDLAQPESAVALLFDADGLYPGLVVPSCVTIAYDGSIPASVRLHASRSGGTGLEDFVEFRLRVSDRDSCPDDDSAAEPDPAVEPESAADPAPLVFDGLLGDLWRTHPDYDRGLWLLDEAEAGRRLVLEAEIELVADDEAQGRTTEFSLIIEARP